MSDYIDREAAMAAACKALCHPGVLCPDFKCAEVRDAFNAIPAADVRENKPGRWIESRVKYIDSHSLFGFKCSECGGFCIGESNFCPNCGAKMGGEEE